MQEHQRRAYIWNFQPLYMLSLVRIVGRVEFAVSEGFSPSGLGPRHN